MLVGVAESRAWSAFHGAGAPDDRVDPSSPLSERTPERFRAARPNGGAGYEIGERIAQVVRR